MLIITGTGVAAVVAGNVYFDRLHESCDLFFIEDKSITPRRSIQTLSRIIRKRGFRYAISCVLARFLSLPFQMKRMPERRYSIYCKSKDMNEDLTRQIRILHPDIVITNACSIVSAAALSETKAAFINVHNGINPRYRGLGNIWAFYEERFDLVGVTVHRLDAGIDTGPVIQTMRMSAENYSFFDVDLEAFRLGAEYISGKLREEGVTAFDQVGLQPARLRSRCYSWPSFKVFITAYLNFEEWRRSGGRSRDWPRHFRELAEERSLDSFQRMAWFDSSTIKSRDDDLKLILSKYDLGALQVLDVGCGDGRYSSFFKHKNYTGIDFIEHPDFPEETNTAFRQANLEDFEWKDETFDVVLCVGIFQHLNNPQKTIDSILEHTRKDGLIIINTLRQFSLFEGAIIYMLSVFNRTRKALIMAILFRCYHSDLKIEGSFLARRYSVSELKDRFGPGANLEICRYRGFANMRFLSRESNIVFRKK